MINRIYLRIIILIVLLLSSNVLEAQKLTDYAKQRKQELADRQRVEKQHYENACKKGTLDALKQYLNMYPKGTYAKDVKNRVTDFDMWNSAKIRNTKESYNYYLKNSKYLSFKTNAESAIVELNSIEEWNALRKDGGITSIESFITKYPNSSCVAQAEKRIYELKAIGLYNTGDYLTAYYEFNKAGGRKEIAPSSINMYNRCVEAYDYSKLNSYSKNEVLEAFLSKYPSSTNYDEVSNWLAIAIAKSFTMYSGPVLFNEALNYAKDEPTRAIVKSYIEKSNRDLNTHTKQLRRERIKANGGVLLFGVEITDFGWNGLSSDKEFDIFYYNVGLSMKIGNFKAPVQFEIGLKPGLTWYTESYSDDYSYGSESEVVSNFHMPAYAKLKVNICSLDKNQKSKLYVCGLGYYNLVKTNFENEYSVGGGMGIAWRHWDWLTLYYRQDLNVENKFNDKFLGTSIVYYFK